MICDFMTMLATLLLGVLVLHAEAYTMFGSRRFVRPVRSPWRPAPPPPSYYTAYQPYVPSSNDYDDELPDDGGALYSDTVNYYPPPRYYYGRTIDPVDDIQMEMRNEERGADLPIGQETWFESQSAAQAAAAERAAANDAFMQNLILAEMYRNQEPSNQYYGYDYGNNNAGFVDEEERELKSLSQVKRADSKQKKLPATPSPSPATTKPFVGMKEVPMLRPPSPARGSKTAVPAPTSGGHQPSVYDTIKQLLSLESKDGNKAHHEGARATRRAPPQKRFVSNEESLVRQLSGLKNKVTA